MSSKKDKSSAEQGIQQAGQSVSQASKMSPEEQAQYTGSFDIGRLLNQLLQFQLGVGQAPQGYQTPEQQYQNQGPLAQNYYQQSLAGVQNPYGAYESQLQPSLQLAQDFINRGAQQRGLLRSGIPIEQMGRAGVELAIKEAQDRMNFRSQELARGGQLSQYAQGIGQQNISNLGSLYGQQQALGQQAMGRQSQGAQVAAGYQAYPYQSQLGALQGQQGQMGALGGAIGGGYLGAAAGAALAPATGGASLAYPLIGFGLGATSGSQLGRSLF